MMYKASIGITTGMSQSAINWIIANADGLGADGIWIGEDIDRGHDVFVLTTAAVVGTKEARIGTGIIPVSVHKPETIARAAYSLQKLADGRFVLGVGIGGLQDLKNKGAVVKKPVTMLENTVSFMRDLWSGETASLKTELFEKSEFNLSVRGTASIPIFLGVRGPQMLELAGRLADGVILSGPFEYLSKAITQVNRAAGNSGRNESDVEKVIWLPTIPTFKDGDENLAKRVVALVVADTPNPVLDLLSIDREKLHSIKEIVSKQGAKAAIPQIDNEVLDMFSISGSKAHILDQFDGLVKLGATEVVIGPPFSGNWREAVEELFEELEKHS